MSATGRTTFALGMSITLYVVGMLLMPSARYSNVGLPRSMSIVEPFTVHSTKFLRWRWQWT